MLNKLVFTVIMTGGIFVVSAAAQQPDRPNRNPDRQNRQERQNRSGRQNGRFAQLDLDHDGYLSSNEWRGNQKAFGRMDTNGDGLVSREEFDFFRQQKGGKSTKPNENRGAER